MPPGHLVLVAFATWLIPGVSVNISLADTLEMYFGKVAHSERSAATRSDYHCMYNLLGWYCSETGLVEPTGQCDEGYYCNGGATLPNPDSSSPDGYKGDTCVDRTNAASNDLCPPGHYCPTGKTCSR